MALAIWASAMFAGLVSVHQLVHSGHTTHLGWAMAAALIGRSLLVEIEGFPAGERSIDEAERVGRQVRDAVTEAVPQVRTVTWSPHSIS